METTTEENEERQDELETPHHEDPIQEDDENEEELNEGTENAPLPEETGAVTTEGEHDAPQEGEKLVETGEPQEEKNESGDKAEAGENAEIDEAEKPESAEDEVFDAESKAKQDEAAESDTEASAHDGTASPTSEKHAVKKRPHRKIQNENMIAEEDVAEESARSPRPPPFEPISQNLDELNNTNVTNDLEIVKPTTPDHHHHEHGSGDEQDHEHEEIIEEEEIKLSREEIIARYHAAMEEKERSQNLNNQLHHKLADYFRRKKPDDAQSQQIFDKTSQDQEQRYLKYLANIEELHKQLEKQQDEFERERYDLKTKCEMKQKMVQEERTRYLALKKETAIKAVGVHSGKSLQMKEIDEYFQKEKIKDQEVVQVRLENIKLKNQVKKKENQLKAKEELGEGLHLIDFEQLKIENQTYNEKIEERNEELMKLKKKINDAVQTLSHVKEKLKFVIMENEKEKDSLGIYDDEVKKKRDILNRMKQSRDSLRLDNNRLKQNSGLLGNSTLLRDFEDCVDENEALLTKIDQLKRKHAELTLNSKGIKQKIMQAKADKN